MSKAQASHSPDRVRGRQTFILYAAGGRVFASNVRQKLIDLGSLRQDGESFSYELDGAHATGKGFASIEDALRNIGESVSFLYLDGQFTALSDLRDSPRTNLSRATQLEVSLDELGRSEPMVNANV